MFLKRLTKLGEEGMNTASTKRKSQYQGEVTELKNTITELKITPEGFNIRLAEPEEWISEPKDRAEELTPLEQQKEK